MVRLDKVELKRAIHNCIDESYAGITDIERWLDGNGIQASRSSIQRALGELRDEGIVNNFEGKWYMASSQPATASAQKKPDQTSASVSDAVTNQAIDAINAVFDKLIADMKSDLEQKRSYALQALA